MEEGFEFSKASIGLISAHGGIRGLTRRVVTVYFCEIKRLILRAMAFTSRQRESALGEPRERVGIDVQSMRMRLANLSSRNCIRC